MYYRDNKTYLTHNDMKAAINAMVTDIQHLISGGDSIHLIGIARGGLNLVQELSNRLKLPYTILKYSVYDRDDRGVVFGLSSDDIEPEEKLYIVDDILDTGKTITKVKEYLENCFEWKPTIEVFTIVGTKTFSKNNYFFFEHESFTHPWVVFPYECDNLNYEICNNCLSGSNDIQGYIYCLNDERKYPEHHTCRNFK